MPSAPHFGLLEPYLVWVDRANYGVLNLHADPLLTGKHEALPARPWLLMCISLAISNPDCIAIPKQRDGAGE
jgi:hypothetical protein